MIYESIAKCKTAYEAKRWREMLKSKTKKYLDNKTNFLIYKIIAVSKLYTDIYIQTINIKKKFTKTINYVT